MSLFGWSYPAGCTGTPYDADDGPETCPVCDAPNWDDDAGVEVYKPDPAFCSKACADAYAATSRIADDATAAGLATDEALVATYFDGGTP